MFPMCVPPANSRGIHSARVLDSAKMRIFSKFFISQVCASAIALSAAAVHAQTAVQPVPAATTITPDTADAGAAPSSTAGVMRKGDSSVRLGIGDLVEVSVYNIADLTTKTRVSSSGDLYLPLIDYVHVAGLTIDEAGAVIERRLDQGGFVKSPHVQLFVAEYNSQGVNVLGEVGKPGTYPALGEQRLFDLVSAAGGLSDRAGKSVIVTHRSEPDKPVTVPISRNLDEHPES